ncbi:MAG: DUF3592 domain-containing protein [Tabrizicola sp.]
MRRLLVLSFVLLILSPLFAGLWVLTDTIRFVAAAEPAAGTVTGTSQAAEKTWYANFRYTDATGATQQARTAWASTFNAYDPGTVLPILYRPDAPGTVRIATPWGLWGFPALILVPTLLLYGLIFHAIRRSRA